MQAIHLLNTLKHGGGENVALNYAKVLSALYVDSTFVGRPCSVEYEAMIRDIVQTKHKLDRKTIRNSDYIFIHSNINLIRLLRFRLLPLHWKDKKVIYIQHLNYPKVKFGMLARLINLLCTDFIQITPITSGLVKRHIRIRTHFIVNFYISRYKQTEWEEVRARVRRELDIPNAARVILFSAVFKPGKNVHEFVNLADKSQNDPNTVFLLIGDGPEADVVKSYRGINLKWLGFVNDVEQYLIASDIYVFLSQFEMMPMALIEAINTNKKIVAYRTLINDFLLDENTFKDIDAGTLQHNALPSGEQLKNYDFDYARHMLSLLLHA